MAVIPGSKHNNFPPRSSWLFGAASKFLERGSDIEPDDFWEMRDKDKAAFLHQDFKSQWMRDEGTDQPVKWLRERRHLFSLSINPTFLSVLFSLGNPIIIPFMVRYVDDPKSASWSGYVMAVSVFVCSVISSLFYYQSQWVAGMIGLKARAVLMAAVYRKVLSSPSMMKSSQGKITNIFSNDSTYLFYATGFLAPGLIAPFQFLAVTVLLGVQVGWSAVICFVVMFGFVLGGNIIISKQNGKLRVKIQKCADRRLKLSQELFRGIKIVKYYAWEDPILEQIDLARGQELVYVRKAAWARVWVWFITTVSSPVIIAFTFLMYEYTSDQNQITPSLAFAVLALVNVLRAPASLMAAVFPIMFNVLASLDRFNQFLRGANRDDYITRYQNKVFIDIRGADFSWESSCKTLIGIDLKMKEGDKVMAVGGIASGKSSLALTILGEIPKTDGSVSVGGTVAYVPQQAWTFGGTIRENILFGKPYDPEKFTKVIRAACLDLDLKVMPDRDLTVIGESGVNLSGGQRQRISIARALYQDCDIYVLDDPFSALDATVTKRIFRKVVKNYLKKKTVFLTTNNMSIVRSATEILYLYQGKITGRGTFDSLYDSHIPFQTLCKTYGADKKINSQQKKIVNLMRNQASRRLLVDMSPKTESSKVDTEDKDDSDFTSSSGEVKRRQNLDEERDKQRLSKIGGGEALGLGGLGSSSNVERAKLMRASTSSINKAAKMITKASRKRKGSESSSESESESEEKAPANLSVKAEARQRGPITWSLLWYYFKAGGLLWFYLIQLCFLLMAGAKFASSLWLGVWSRDMKLLSNSTHTTNYWIGTYSAWLGAEIVSTFLGMVVAIVLFSFAASRWLQRRLISKIAFSVMNFFDTTPIDDQLIFEWRLSIDMALIDYLLPVIVANYFYYIYQILSTVASVGYGTWYILLTWVPLFLGFFFLQRYFSRTNIEIQRLEANARSPAVSHMSSTIIGIESIRAYQYEERFSEVSSSKIDLDSSAKFALKFAQMWYGLRMEFIGTLGVLFVFLGIVLVRNYWEGGLDSSSAGVAMSATSGLSLLLAAWSMRAVEFDVRMNSIERFADFDKNEQEASVVGEPADIPPDWPKGGAIKFDKVAFKYRTGGRILHNFSIDIPAKAKVGIVGRTGAGKSSIFESLLRMENPEAGEIFIDGLPTTRIPIKTLRTVISVIPQNPVIFSGPSSRTLRKNLDPYGEHADETLWDVLNQTSLSSVVQSLDGKLDCAVAENGENFSVGQRQLICIARAVLRRAPIVLLDEPTASVDVLTDMLVKKLVAEVFKDCTVLTISHRLGSVMDCDYIMVLDKGVLVEFDKPSSLLAIKSGYLRAMVSELSLEAARQLYQLAGVVSATDLGSLGSLSSTELVDTLGDRMVDLRPHMGSNPSIAFFQQGANVLGHLKDDTVINAVSNSTSSMIQRTLSKALTTFPQEQKNLGRAISKRTEKLPEPPTSATRESLSGDLDDAVSEYEVPLFESSATADSSGDAVRDALTSTSFH